MAECPLAHLTKKEVESLKKLHERKRIASLGANHLACAQTQVELPDQVSDSSRKPGLHDVAAIGASPDDASSLEVSSSDDNPKSDLEKEQHEHPWVSAVPHRMIDDEEVMKLALIPI